MAAYPKPLLSYFSSKLIQFCSFMHVDTPCNFCAQYFILKIALVHYKTHVRSYNQFLQPYLRSLPYEEYFPEFPDIIFNNERILLASTCFTLASVFAFTLIRQASRRIDLNPILI